MSSLRLAERERAAAERTRAAVLCERSRVLREEADVLSGGLVRTVRSLEGRRPAGDRGDVFSLHLPRLPVALGLLRQALTVWLEHHGVAADDATEIALASSEPC